jgi:hypothetical protein
MRMRRTILPSVTCLTSAYFSTLSHKRQDFREKVIEHKMCVLIFSTTFVWNISHSKKNWARYFHKRTYVVMYSMLLLSDVNKTSIFWIYFPKVLKYQISRKSVPVGAELFHADGQTDMTRPIAAFRNFRKRVIMLPTRMVTSYTLKELIDVSSEKCFYIVWVENPEDGGSFLRRNSKFLTHCTTSHPWRRYWSNRCDATLYYNSEYTNKIAGRFIAGCYTGCFIMCSRITKIYDRKTIGHVFTKPVQIEGTTKFFSPDSCFSS